MEVDDAHRLAVVFVSCLHIFLLFSVDLRNDVVRKQLSKIRSCDTETAISGGWRSYDYCLIQAHQCRECTRTRVLQVREETARASSPRTVDRVGTAVTQLQLLLHVFLYLKKWQFVYLTLTVFIGSDPVRRPNKRSKEDRADKSVIWSKRFRPTHVSNTKYRYHRTQNSFPYLLSHDSLKVQIL